ncbi:MAG: type II and III secretion system protein [Gammaproteobacteria bacterium]|nr:type II and III secretion system protein [Gammaproteobacteria bacterium]
MKKYLLLAATLMLSACASVTEPDLRMAVSGHINEQAPAENTTAADIPPVVQQVPIIAAPEPVEPMQTFTVVATDVPASELLFALARDARLNLDIDPSIDGRVSINAIDQTLPQILQRISRQVALRYYVDGPNLVVQVDRPFLRIYNVDYLNMSRTTTSDVGIETQLGESGEDGGSTGDSSASITAESDNQFWRTLEANIELLASAGGADGVVISNRETGTVSVQTTSVNHANIQRFIDTILASARRQVLIEATVVEVTLNDDFQAGVDWARIATDGSGWSFSQQLLGASAGTPLAPSLGESPITSATYLSSNSDRTISAAVQALDTFGEVSVMSSPKIMALNNQTSILKVADNVVYFEVESTGATVSDGVTIAGVTNTTPKTVPVGFVMNVTPFISADNEVTLNIRPTITRIIGFAVDPNPDLTIENLIPEIQVRELESVMRVASGNTAVIGGLMQDSVDSNESGLPGLHDMKGVGVLFGTETRQSDKTELVIFLRPRVIDNASLDTSLQDFQKYLQPEVFSNN